MNPKTTVGMVVALLVAVIGVWWAVSSESKPAPQKQDDAPKPIFELPLGELVRFEVQSGDKPPFVFEMVDAKWRMVEPLRGPSQHFIVSGDAIRLRDLKYVKVYAKDDPDRPEPSITSLDSPRQILRLTDKDNETHALRFGVEQALSGRVYAQKEGDDAIYLIEASDYRQFKKDMTDYRGKRVAEFLQTDAARIEVTGQRPYTLVKSDNSWVIETPVKARAQQSRVSTLLSSISNMSVMNFVEDDAKNLRIYGLEQPTAVVTITTEKKTPRPPPTTAEAEGPTLPEFDVETRTIRVALGAKAETKVFARMPDVAANVVFQVSESVLKQVLPEMFELRDKRVTEIATGSASKVTVARDGQTVDLVKNAGKWQIAAAPPREPQDAEFAAVDDLLKAIRDLKATGFEDEPRTAFGLDSPRATVEITAEGRLDPVKLTIGSETPSKTGVYIRNERDGLVSVVSAASVEPLLVSPHAFLSRKLLQIDRARASRIEITRGATSYAVARQDGVWKFAAPVQGQALFVAVDAILADLANLRGRRVVGLAADAAKFGLDNPGIRVAVTIDPLPKPAATQPATQPASQPASQPATQPVAGPESPTVHTVLVNKHTDEKVYATVAGGLTVCEVDAKVYDDLSAELFSTLVVVVDPSQASMLAWGGATPFRFDKIGDKWTLEGEASFQTNIVKFTEVLNALRDMRATHFVRYAGAQPAEFGLDAPAVALTVKSGSEAPVTLSVSASGPDDGGRYASVSTASDRVFVIKSEDVDKIAKQVTDFRRAG